MPAAFPCWPVISSLAMRPPCSRNWAALYRRPQPRHCAPQSLVNFGNFQLSLIHPQGSTALASMQPLGPTESLNEHWRLTRFVQAPNVAAYLLALAVLPDSVFERVLMG